MTVIYADTMLLVNGIINYLLLLTTGRLAGVHLYRIRLLLGSLLGAIYSIAVYLPDAGFLQKVPFKIGVGIFMLLIGYGGVRRFFRLSLLFFAVSFAFSGSVLALQFLSGDVLMKNGGFVAAAGAEELLLAAAFCYLVLSVVFRRSAKHGGSRQDIVQIRAIYHCREATFSALVDSGNTLTDPMTNAPVIVASLEAVEPLFTADQKDVLTTEALQSPPLALERLKDLGENRFFLIPYRAVGVSVGLLLTLRPDAVYLGTERYDKILIAISPTSISDGGSYTALVGDLGDCENKFSFAWKVRKERGGAHETNSDL